MRLVKFDDDTYGVRKYWFFGWHFVDLTTSRYAWSRGNVYFKDCKGTKEQAERAMNNGGTGYQIL